MTKKEKYDLAKIVFEFTEVRTRLNSPSDGDLVANEANERFKEISKKFKLKDELIDIIENYFIAFIIKIHRYQIHFISRLLFRSYFFII